MENQAGNIADDFGNLSKDVQDLLSSTAHIAEGKVVEARNKLSVTLEKGKAAWKQVQEKACESAKQADEVVRKNPYQAIGVAFGLGALLGFLITRRD